MSDVPENDAREQALTLEGLEEPEPPQLGHEVPEADALEQSLTVEDLPGSEPPHLGLEVPEADALEQAQELPVVDEDYGA